MNECFLKISLFLLELSNVSNELILRKHSFIYKRSTMWY